MSKAPKTRGVAVAVPAGPQRVLVITPRGRRRLAWLAPDGTVVDRRTAAQ